MAYLIKRSRLWLPIVCLALGLQAYGQTNSAYQITHYQSQARYHFGHDLLVLALSKLDQPYTVNAFSDYPVNEARGEKMLLEGKFDIQWLSTSRYRESKLIPIKIPIYKGLLGLRLLLVTKENKEKLSQIRTLKDLRQYTGGHGSHWGDLPVYAANQLPVHPHAQYAALFLQLADNRFDYFHRGLNEIWEEQAKYSERLEIADSVMLYYPHPVYYFVNKDDETLAAHIKSGLEMALKDGSYKRLFLKHHESMIKKSRLDERQLILLKNPILPKGTPTINTQWWLPVKSQ